MFLSQFVAKSQDDLSTQREAAESDLVQHASSASRGGPYEQDEQEHASSASRGGPFLYEQEVPFEIRAAEAARIVEKFPTRIPLVCERKLSDKGSSQLPTLNKKKFLVPGIMTLAQFSVVLKQQIAEEHPEQRHKETAKLSLYFLLKNRQSPVLSKALKDLYETSKSPDGFLYLWMCEEAVFGGSDVEEDDQDAESVNELRTISRDDTYTRRLKRKSHLLTLVELESAIGSC
ncbi:unnamed protein product [Amoebophrya sp. A25]|nr:unnamed protein product [Amoebophrya sp. A25]|eukprot:GSA25T00026486001.1